MRFPTPIEQALDDDYSLVIPSARLKGGYPVAEAQVYNGVLIYSDLIPISSSKAREEFAKRVRSKTGIAEEVTEKALLIVSGNLSTTLADELEDEAGDDRGASQSTRIVEIGSRAELFHDPDKNAYATFEIDDHRETHRIKSRAFKRWLMQQYYEQTDSVANAQAYSDALAVLEAKAIFNGTQCPVNMRVAGTKTGKYYDTIYIDLGNDKWDCVKITKGGWEVVSEPPVKFRRATGVAPLPYPVRGGSIDELFRFANVVKAAERQLCCSWVMQGYLPDGPYPPLAINGGQGSAKTTCSAVLRGVIDPNTAPLRSAPRSEHDLMIAANNGWLVCFDNLSGLSEALSDSLCRLATGGGFSTRELYSDAEEVIFNVKRPVIFNGIEEIISKGDLLQRAVSLTLPKIEDEDRISELEFWAMYEEARPRILGALYDALSAVLRELPDVKLTSTPRMADFAYVGVAAEKAFGYEPGSFLKAYADNARGANSFVLESEPIAEVTCAFIKEQIQWSGRATDLLKELNAIADEKTQRLKSWPRSAAVLGNRLRRLAPNLLPVGVAVTFDQVGHAKTRTIFLKYLGEMPSAPSAPSAENGSDENRRETEGEARTAKNDADSGVPGADGGENSPSAGNYKKEQGDSPDAGGADGKSRPPYGRDYSPCPTCGNEGIRFNHCGECGEFIR